MNTSRVQLELEEWPESQWIVRADPLGTRQFVLIEADGGHPLDSPEGLTYLFSVVLGGGFTAPNLPRILRGVADLVEEQNARLAV